MTARSPKVENGEVELAVRSAIHTHGQVVIPPTGGAVRGLTPERWVVDLLLVVLTGLIVGATALGGLAIVSTWAPAPDRAPVDLTMCGQQAVESVALEVCGDPACCWEVR
jgi:hypothetical protein